MAGLFKKLSALFESEVADGSTGTDRTAVAVAALMVRLANADGSFDEAERASIEAALDARFGDGAALLAAGEAAEQDALDNHQFTKLIKSAYSPEERGALLEDLWGVVLADENRDMNENALMRQFAALLYVPDREVAEARQRAEAGRAS